MPQDEKTPHSKSLEVLNGQLSLLRDLNKDLPKSIATLQNEILSEWNRRVQESDAATKEAIDKVTEWAIDAVRTADGGTERKLDQELLALLKEWRITPEASKLVSDLLDSALRFGEYYSFIRKMSLVYLVSQFESYLQKILHASFEKWPMSIGEKKGITFEQLISCKNLDEAKGLVMQKEISGIMREDIDKIDKQLSDRWGVRMSGFPDWRKASERFYRRNMIIHNDGMPDDVYIHKTGNTGTQSRLDVSQDYIEESIDLFSKVGDSVCTQFNNKTQTALQTQ